MWEPSDTVPHGPGPVGLEAWQGTCLLILSRSRMLGADFLPWPCFPGQRQQDRVTPCVGSAGSGGCPRVLGWHSRFPTLHNLSFLVFPNDLGKGSGEPGSSACLDGLPTGKAQCILSRLLTGCSPLRPSGPWVCAFSWLITSPLWDPLHSSPCLRARPGPEQRLVPNISAQTRNCLYFPR